MKSIAAALAMTLVFPNAFAGLLVTELTGRAEIEGKGLIATLMEIPDGSKINLSMGANLTVVDLASGREYLLKSGRKYMVSDSGPKALDGSAIETKHLPTKNLPEFRIGVGKASQATLVMRSVRETAIPLLLSPVRTATITATPTFRWNSVESAVSYRLSLKVKDGGRIWDVTTRELEMPLPSDRALSAGESYTWRIEAVGTSGVLSDASTGFFVLDSSAMERLAKLKPDANATLSRRVLYAAQLEEAGAIVEAKEAWKALAKDRPTDAVLRALGEPNSN